MQTEEQKVVVFRLGKDEFAAEIKTVLEISRMLPMTHVPQAPEFIEGVINLRGKVIAVVNLAKQFGIKEQPASSKESRIVILELEGETIGLWVDEVVEVLNLPKEKREPLPEFIQNDAKRECLSGVGKIGDRLILLIDFNRVLRPEQLQALGKAA